MAKVTLDFVPQTQITAPNPTADNIAHLLTLTTDDQCLVPEVVIQADPSNTGKIYVGNVDGNGVAQAASGKAHVLSPGDSLVLTADENTGDEDSEVYDLRRLSVLGSIAAQKVNVSFVQVHSKQYTR